MHLGFNFSFWLQFSHRPQLLNIRNKIDEAPKDKYNIEGCVHRGCSGGNIKIKKGFLMDYKCRGNWYTAVAKSSQVKQSVNAVRVWLNMLERCLPSTPPPLLCIVAKKSWGISQRSLNQNLNTRHLVNTLGETEIGSRSADISTVMDIHGRHVSLCLSFSFSVSSRFLPQSVMYIWLPHRHT